MDFDQARLNMIESQIRIWEVLDQKVLDALRAVRREDYVPERYRVLAFADMQIPIGHGEAMLTPRVEARLLQAAALLPADNVLEVGTGSGHMTALLASQAAHVYSIELHADLTESARRKLAAHGVHNVTLETGDAARGWSRHTPYDVIVLTGSAPQLPEAFLQQLRPGGRLVAVLGEAPVMTATLVSARGGGVFHRERLFETCIPALHHVPQPERFVF